MILSSTNLSAVTAKPSIIEDIDFLVDTDSVRYPIADKLRSINAYYYDCVTDIIASQSNWEWDDSNKTDYPIGTTTLVAGQQDYTLPTNLLKILRIEVKDVNGNYQKLTQFDEQQINGIGLSTFMDVDGFPLYYREVANAVELYPAPASGSVTLSAGLKIYYERTQTEFTTADASVSPGLPANFHRILSLGAAYDYAFINMLPKVTNLKVKLDEMRASLKEYFSSRNREVKPKLRGKYRNYE